MTRAFAHSRMFLAVTASVVAAAMVPAAAAAFDPPFSPSSPFNQLLPASPAPGTNGAGLGSSTRAVNYMEFTPAVYTSATNQPLYTLKLKNQGSWGNNPVHNRQVRIPASARPNNDSDGHLTIVVPSEGVVISLYQAELGPRADGTWWATWAGLAPLSGNGANLPNANGGRESGISQLAGLIHPDDVRRGIAMGNEGDLGHALSVGYGMVHATTFVSPAITARGTSTSPQALFMGQKIFIDPSLDIESLPWEGTPENRRFGKLIARTLQRYGAIVVTNAGALNFQLWHPNSFTGIGQSDPWPGLIGPAAAGYYGFTTRAIPASAFRTLAPGQAGRPGPGVGTTPPATTTPASPTRPGGTTKPGRPAAKRVLVRGPKHGATVRGRIRWSVRPVGLSVKRVDFLVNGKRRWADERAPYIFTGKGGGWNSRVVSNTRHRLTVRVVLRNGKVVTRTQTFVVRNRRG